MQREWHPVSLTFTPATDAPFLLIGAYFTDPSNPTYGNLQLDELTLQEITRGAIPPSIPSATRLVTEPSAADRTLISFAQAVNDWIAGATPPTDTLLTALLWEHYALYLTVGIRARTPAEFRLLRARFRKAWKKQYTTNRPPLIEFMHLEDGIREADWTFHAADAIYWLRVAK